MTPTAARRGTSPFLVPDPARGEHLSLGERSPARRAGEGAPATRSAVRTHPRGALGVMLLLLPLLGAGPPPARTRDAGVVPARVDVKAAPGATRAEPSPPRHAGPTARAKPAADAPAAEKPAAEAAKDQGPAAGLVTPETLRSLQSVALFALVSFAPAALLMVTAFVRINIVLLLLRQALGSPQVPGNQVLTVLALLLTALVMRPVAETVYNDAVAPFAAGRASAAEAWEAGTKPVKAFMLEQIERTNHHHYVWTLYEHTARPADEPEPKYGEDFPLRVVAPAFLLSELTTALTIGFYLYLPFLVIDLVVSAVLASMGLFMLPPSLVALPLKLILFVLADGWLLVAAMLLQSFGGVT